ncbi:MAG: hypothetical protein KW793_04895, partial [Candidatus Doudnabacteria bacterium]|nr:hypothetical protein [Candidatus Doudnabacteria bacterium]
MNMRQRSIENSDQLESTLKEVGVKTAEPSTISEEAKTLPQEKKIVTRTERDITARNDETYDKPRYTGSESDIENASQNIETHQKIKEGAWADKLMKNLGIEEEKEKEKLEVEAHDLSALAKNYEVETPAVPVTPEIQTPQEEHLPESHYREHVRKHKSLVKTHEPESYTKLQDIKAQEADAASRIKRLHYQLKSTEGSRVENKDEVVRGIQALSLLP